MGILFHLGIRLVPVGLSGQSKRVRREPAGLSFTGWRGKDCGDYRSVLTVKTEARPEVGETGPEHAPPQQAGATDRAEWKTNSACGQRSLLWSNEELDLPHACERGQQISALVGLTVEPHFACGDALNTGMPYSEIRLLCWRQIDFVARILTVGKSKSPTGTGRAIPLNSRILRVLEMWAAQFPSRQPAHFVFPSEKYGAAGEEETYGFTAGPVVYDTDPTRPIGDWKEAWEKAKERAGAILSAKTEEEESEPLQCRFHDLRHTAVTRLLEAGIPYPVVLGIYAPVGFDPQSSTVSKAALTVPD